MIRRHLAPDRPASLVPVPRLAHPPRFIHLLLMVLEVAMEMLFGFGGIKHFETRAEGVELGPASPSMRGPNFY